MNEPAPTHPYADIREMILKVTALCAEAAEDVAGDLRQTVDPERRSRCIADLEKMARAVRAGGLAIARLDHEARGEVRARRSETQEAQRAAATAVEARREARVRSVIARLPWPEEERLDALFAFDELGGFDDLSFEDVVELVCREANLETPDIPDEIRAAGEAALRQDPEHQPGAQIIALRPPAQPPDSS